jgi:hypothetical protein
MHHISDEAGCDSSSGEVITKLINTRLCGLIIKAEVLKDPIDFNIIRFLDSRVGSYLAFIYIAWPRCAN